MIIPIPDPSAEFLPLPMAAAVAYLRLVHHDQREPASEGLLDVVASALSVWLPLYGGEPRARLADELVSQGKFCNGATRLHFRDGTPPIENLSILQSDLEAGVQHLERAGVRFSEARLEHASRRAPRVPPPTA
jgi:hypothetical protein